MSEREAAGLGVPQLCRRCVCGRIVPLDEHGRLAAHRTLAPRLVDAGPGMYGRARRLLDWPDCPGDTPPW